MRHKSFSILIAFYGLVSSAYANEIPDPVEGWEELWHELMIDITVIGVIFAAVTLYMLIKYRKRHPSQQGMSPKLSPIVAFGWVIIPALIFLADDLFLAAKNFELWKKYRNVPKDAYTIELESVMWSWNFTYPEGIKVINELRVPVGKPVMVKMKSRDVVHSLFLPDFRVKEDSMPGRETYLWFYPKKVGEYVMTCAEYCGTLHSGMYGKVIVMPEDEFLKWVKENKETGGNI